MIKTDKVIYRTRTLEEYNWLMTELDEAGCRWKDGDQPRAAKVRFGDFRPDLCICLENKKIFHACFAFLNGNPDFRDHEVIEVSDIMEDEDESEILDKLEDLKRIEDEFKNLCEKYDEKYDEQKDKTQKIKKIVFTTEVCFE